MSAVGRNEPCPCGSGKKYKQCCGRAGAAKPELKAKNRVFLLWAAAVLVLGLALGFGFRPLLGQIVGAGGLVALGFWYLFGNPPSSRGGGSPGAINFGR